MKQKLNIVLAGIAVGCIITGYVLIAQENRVGPFLSVVGFALMIPAIMRVKMKVSWLLFAHYADFIYFCTGLMESEK